MKNNTLINKILGMAVALFLFNTVEAGSPLLTFTPLTATSLSLPANDTANVQYLVTNQSTKPHVLTIEPIQAVTQLTTGLGICSSRFTLTGKASCILSLRVNGSQLTQSISDGPVLCEEGSRLLCYRPDPVNILRVTQAPAITDATISVTGSALTLTTDGPTGTLTINNDSLLVSATNITSNFTGTALDGNVTETGNTCTSVAPQSSCTLTYTPGSTTVAQTNFPIQGSNTNAVTARMQIDLGIALNDVSPSSGPASGGTSVTLTGIGLTGATSVTFDGTAATSVNVVNSTTVTAVTPAHGVGAVDVVITTPSGSATDTSGFTYVATAVGQPAYGGTIACLNGNSNNLIAATMDNSTGIQWGDGDITVGASAQSITDGSSNTAAIVSALGNNGGVPYAAQLCNDYEIDTQGNSPCVAGNTCYNDWFLPAGNNTTDSGQLNCLYVNRVAIGNFANIGYWSSTEYVSDTRSAYLQDFGSGGQFVVSKPYDRAYVRCVRAFNP